MTGMSQLRRVDPPQSNARIRLMSIGNIYVERVAIGHVDHARGFVVIAILIGAGSGRPTKLIESDNEQNKDRQRRFAPVSSPRGGKLNRRG